MTVLIADTSGLFSLFDADAPEHAAYRRAVADASHLVVSPLVLAELDCLLSTQVGHQAAHAALGHVRDRAAVRR
ncbi:PIN domain-containing protein [Streptomyces sp. NPDC051740]|uniref:PIN domain-containing protein n=1 Tax=Streptomyces sp. NPDC051740 TaxID=3365673 RepID=UPI0037BC8C3A